MSFPPAGSGSWVETLVNSSADGATLSAAGPASLLPAAAKFVIPANKLQVGHCIRVTAYGRVSNIVTTPGNLTLDVRFNSTPIVVYNGGAMALNTTAKTNVTWCFTAILQIRSIGSGTAATLLGIGDWTSESVAGAAAGGTLTYSCPASGPAVGTGFDSTVANVVDFFATFSIGGTGNAITCHQWCLEYLG